MNKFPDLDDNKLYKLGKSFGLKTNDKKSLIYSLMHIKEFIENNCLHPDLQQNYDEKINEIFS